MTIPASLRFLAWLALGLAAGAALAQDSRPLMFREPAHGRALQIHGEGNFTLMACASNDERQFFNHAPWGEVLPHQPGFLLMRC